MPLLWLYRREEGCSPAVLVSLLGKRCSKTFISQDSIFYILICPLRDILYPCRTEIHMVKSMIEILMSNLWIVAPALWACFTAYVVWYSTKAKSYAPLTQVEAKQLWTIHRQNLKCGSKKWRQIRNHDKTVGFECGCGHKHLQKRPIVSNSPAPPTSMKTTTLNTMQTSRNSS